MIIFGAGNCKYEEEIDIIQSLGTIDAVLPVMSYDEKPWIRIGDKLIEGKGNIKRWIRKELNK